MRLYTIVILIVLGLNYQAQNDFQNFGNLHVHAGAQVGVFGDFTNQGSFFSYSGELRLCGSSLQSFTGSWPIHIYDFILDNPNDLKLDNELRIGNTLTFSDGMIYTDVADMASEFVHFLPGSTYSGVSDTRHVDGVVRKMGQNPFTFPVGNNGNLQEISISAPSVISDHYTGYYLANSVDGSYSRLATTGCVDHVSDCEYWVLNRTGGSSNVNVSLSFDEYSCGVDNLCELLVTRWDGSNWVSEGNGGTTGTTAEGTVTSGTSCGSCGVSQNVTSYGPFTLGSSSKNNPLPVELLLFEAKLNNQQVELKWITQTEINNDFFTVEKSVDGVNWEKVLEKDGAGNSYDVLEYSDTDYSPYYGVSYYRLKQTDFNGEFQYSNIEVVEIDALQSTLSVYPNPTAGVVTIAGTPIEMENLKIFNLLGQDVSNMVKTTQNQGQTVLNLSSLAKGNYLIKTNSKTAKVSLK